MTGPTLRSAAAILTLMAAAGWPGLAMPFRGDQAYYAVVAQELSRGATLYRDHWDITNPGVFWFYRLAGGAFGFTEEGVRLAEWLWVTASVLGLAALGRRAGEPRLPLAPALFVGVPYYLAGCSSTSALTKTEGLVGLPLVLAVWLPAALVAGGPGKVAPRLVAAGAAAGVVVLFKSLLGACVGVAWLYLLAEAARARGVRPALGAAAWVALGLLLVAGPAVGGFAARGLAGELARTVFVMPPRFLAEGERAGLDRLAESGRWFLSQYAPVLALAVLCFACRLGRGRDPVSVALALALAASGLALLAQRLSWWPYHFLLPGTLAGALAARGWPALADAVRARLGGELTGRERGVIVVVAAVLSAQPLAAWAYQFARLAGHDFVWTAAGRRGFREGTGTAYREALRETAWLREPGAAPGPILVCGDPLFYWLSGRVPAVRVSGWSLELYPAETRQELADSVRAARPAYVYVSAAPDGYDRLIEARYPGLARGLAEDYAPVRRSRGGTWYAPRP